MQSMGTKLVFKRTIIPKLDETVMYAEDRQIIKGYIRLRCEGAQTDKQTNGQGIPTVRNVLFGPSAERLQQIPFSMLRSSDTVNLQSFAITRLMADTTLNIMECVSTVNVFFLRKRVSEFLVIK
jgi:hypothetical protein